jgi:hypothetical protein
MASSFYTTTKLGPHGTYPSPDPVWDTVITYNKFFAQIVADTPCQLTVYESNDANPTVDNSAIFVYNYNSINNCVIIEGNITCNKIYFSLRNTLNVGQTKLYFSVIYK